MSTAERIAPRGPTGPLVRFTVEVRLPEGMTIADAAKDLQQEIHQGNVFGKRFLGPGDRPCLRRARVEALKSVLIES